MSVAIVGCPRSGTSLLYAMLRAALTDDWQTYDREYRAEPSARRVVTKRPRDVFNPDIERPEVEPVLVVRDPRAILCSTHWNVADDWFIHADRGWFATWDGKRSLTNPGVLAYFQRMSEILEQTAAVVRFEVLLTDPAGVGESLDELTSLTFERPLGEGWREMDHGFRLGRAMRGVRALDHERIDGWMDHPGRVRQQFEQFSELHEHLKLWNYEANDAWWEGLCAIRS